MHRVGASQIGVGLGSYFAEPTPVRFYVSQERRLKSSLAAAPGGVAEFERAIRSLSKVGGGGDAGGSSASSRAVLPTPPWVMGGTVGQTIPA